MNKDQTQFDAYPDEGPLGAADPELEALLRDAFDAPPVPRTLLKRLDQVVQQEWGVSPQLAGRSGDRWHRSLWKGVHRLRGFPMAAALAAVVLIAAIF